MSEPNGNGFTPTQRKFLAVLGDGLSHGKDELFKCLFDELSEMNVVPMHISNLRKKLRPKGQDIVCELHAAGSRYRLVRILASAVDGRT